jgi:hypothetical protein
VQGRPHPGQNRLLSQAVSALWRNNGAIIKTLLSQPTGSISFRRHPHVKAAPGHWRRSGGASPMSGPVLTADMCTNAGNSSVWAQSRPSAPQQLILLNLLPERRSFAQADSGPLRKPRADASTPRRCKGIASIAHEVLKVQDDPMVRRSALLAVGGFDEGQVSPDWDLWMRLSWDFKVAWAAAFLVRYRYHEGNTSKKYGPQIGA